MDKELFTTTEAVEYMREHGVEFSPGTLEVWRCQGRGPAFRKIYRKVFYAKGDLDNFLNGQRVMTTDSIGCQHD